MEDLQEFITKDGSFSLHSKFYNENFHSSLGAFSEAKNKFICPSNLSRFKGKSLSVLDICFGLGYNSAFLFNDLLKQSSRLNWYALELDKRPLMHSIKNENFRSLWEPKVNQIFDSLLFNSSFEDNSFSCKLLWGDARNQISKIPININFDLVFLDGFSPQKCPEIWSVEFISNIKTKLKKGGCIITYCSSAAVRKTFIDLGLVIYNILPDTKTKNFWSIGTLALEAINTNEHQINPYIEKLTLMELEHLKTKAAVPYRDPDINSLSLEILQRRNNEQRLSLLADTNKWRKKWNMTKST